MPDMPNTLPELMSFLNSKIPWHSFESNFTASTVTILYNEFENYHYSDVIMGVRASQITSLATVYSAIYSGAAQRKHPSSASLAFVRGIHRWPVNFPHKNGQQRGKCFHLTTSSWCFWNTATSPADQWVNGVNGWLRVVIRRNYKIWITAVTLMRCFRNQS